MAVVISGQSLKGPVPSLPLLWAGAGGCPPLSVSVGCLPEATRWGILRALQALQGVSSSSQRWHLQWLTINQHSVQSNPNRHSVAALPNQGINKEGKKRGEADETNKQWMSLLNCLPPHFLKLPLTIGTHWLGCEEQPGPSPRARSCAVQPEPFVKPLCGSWTYCGFCMLGLVCTFQLSHPPPKTEN